MTENQNKILDFFEKNINVEYSISDIQHACFERPISRRRGFGNIKIINSIKKLIKEELIYSFYPKGSKIKKYIAYESPKNRLNKKINETIRKNK